MQLSESQSGISRQVLDSIGVAALCRGFIKIMQCITLILKELHAVMQSKNPSNVRIKTLGQEERRLRSLSSFGVPQNGEKNG